MEELRLTLFGAPQISLGKSPLTRLITGKTQALFIYLAVTGTMHTRDMLASLLWGELSLPQARNNLRSRLSDLRRVVGDYLVVTPQTISFNHNRPYWLDVEVVRAALTSTAQANRTAVQEALILQQGEFLAGLRVRNAPQFMAWVEEQRQMFHQLTVQALTPTSQVKNNLPHLLTPFLGREYEITEIVAHLCQDTERLCTIIGEGGVGKTRLALAVAQALLQDADTPAAFSSQRFRLWDSVATDAKAFIGAENLKSKSLKSKFPDGIWFIPLADLTPTDDLPEQLATAIGKALHFTFSGQGTAAAQIIHYLANKQILLILDNFEHLHAGIDFLLELLYKTTAAKLLITSRHRLNVQAEYPWRITGLPLPPIEQATTLTVEEVLAYPGVAFFMERARHAQPGFQIDPAEQVQMLQICHFVQGLPLGIELAAALTKEYACTALLNALQQDYAVLQSPLPDLTDRHRNIKLVLSYSWRFLRAEEARILAECTLFRGGFDQAAAAITGATPAMLAALVDQSLLHWSTEIAGHRRYALHALVRQYAQEQWAQSPLRRQVQMRYATYYLGLLEQAEAALLQDRVAQEQLRCDLANIRAAWFWCIEQGEWALLLQGVEALARFYHLTGLHHEGLQTLHAALPVARHALTITEHAQPLLASLLSHSSEFCRYLNQLVEAEILGQEALTLGEQTADVALLSRAYHELARVAQRRNQQALMCTFAQQAADLARQSGIARLQAVSFNALGVSEVLSGNPVQAIHAYQTALRYFQRSPDRELEAMVMANLGGAYKRCREYSAAVHYLLQSVTLTDSIHDQYGAAVNRVLLGNLWLELGAYDRAQIVYTQAFHIFEDIHDPYWEAWGRTSQALLWLLYDEPEAAMRECLRVLPWVQDKMPLFEHRALTYLGDAYCALGEWAEAEELYQKAFALQQTANLHFRLTEPVIRLAERLLAQEQNAAALALLEAPLAEMTKRGPASSAEPFMLYSISYAVLKANADRRADIILLQAYTLLQEIAAKIDTLDLQQSFLENLPHRRKLLALAQERFARTAAFMV